MRVTGISTQVKNPDRVNVSIDGTYRFSLDISQLIDLGIKVGNEYSEAQLVELETESQFGKLYARALEYCLMRPHSAREIRDYLWRKTIPQRRKKRDGSGIAETPGVSKELADRVFGRLSERGYVDDEKFARFWAENRHQRKGTSLRKLNQELRNKGVEQSVIASVLMDSPRDDQDELRKVLAKKAKRYDDPQKLMQYLMRQGFSYDDIRAALTAEDNYEE